MVKVEYIVGTICAGMDVRAFLVGESPTLPDRGFAGVTGGPPAKPLIAAVEGHAVAGGFEIEAIHASAGLVSPGWGFLHPFWGPPPPPVGRRSCVRGSAA